MFLKNCFSFYSTFNLKSNNLPALYPNNDFTDMLTEMSIELQKLQQSEINLYQFY